MELEENIQRKDLTEIERSRNLTELVEATAEAICEEKKAFPEVGEINRTEPVHLNNPNKIGDRKIAERIGVPRQTIRDAQQHVKAVDKYPQLVDFPKHKAIETAKTLDKAPAEQQPEIIKQIKEANRRVDHEYKQSKQIFDIVYCGFGEIITEQAVEIYLAHHSDKTIDEHLKILNEFMSVLEQIKNILLHSAKARRIK